MMEPQVTWPHKRAEAHFTSHRLLLDKNDGINNYQRLEFFGDATLDFLVLQHLFGAHPNKCYNSGST
jgi:dsRNA-specific ribonuclease